jgi:hypothetical protein
MQQLPVKPWQTARHKLKTLGAHWTPTDSRYRLRTLKENY